MECPNCNANVGENVNYCSRCGCNLKTKKWSGHASANERDKEFKSIHVDLENKIFELNGIPMGRDIESMMLSGDKGVWRIYITYI